MTKNKFPKKKKKKRRKKIIVENEGLYGSITCWNIGKYAKIHDIYHFRD
jgi:hypothetical protein